MSRAVRFQTQICLWELHLLLLSGTDDVATAGYRLGRDSISQFSRELLTIYSEVDQREVGLALRVRW